LHYLINQSSYNNEITWCMQGKASTFDYKCSICTPYFTWQMSNRYWNSSQHRCSIAASTRAVTFQIRPRKSVRDCVWHWWCVAVIFAKLQKKKRTGDLGDQGVVPQVVQMFSAGQSSYLYRCTLYSEGHHISV